MPNVEFFHQDSSIATLTANVFKPDYSEREFAIVLSDVGHLGLYTANCTTMVAGDLVQIKDSSISKFIGAYKYEPNLAITAASIADAVWDEAVSGHTTSTTFGGKNQKVVPSEDLADYKITGFATSAKQDTMETTLNDVPTTSEFNARTLPSADYVVVTDTIARVTLVDTTTTNTDLAGLKALESEIHATWGTVIGNAEGTDIAADIAAIKAETVTILADTNEIQGKLPTGYLMGSSDVSNHDTDIDSILADTNEIQGKLPTNNIMGSSVKTDKDDDIDAILVDTTAMPTSADIQTACDTAITNNALIVALPTLVDMTAAKTEINNNTDAKIVALNNISTANIRTELATELAEVTAIKAITDQLLFTSGTVNANIATSGIGTGSIKVDYYVFTNEIAETGAIANVSTWVSSDLAGTTGVASGMTDSDGKVTFYLNAGTYYIWRTKAGYTFVNPDQEIVS